MSDQNVPTDVPSFLIFCAAIVGRSVLIFAFGLAALRMGKSRTLSQATAFDALLVLMLGSVLARGLVSSVPLITIFLSSTTLVVLHWLLSRMSYGSHRVGGWIKGHARKLMSDGVIDWNEMAKSHMTEHDLMEELRLNANIEDLKRVQSAYKERSGAIGVVCKTAEPKVITIAVEDGVQTVRVMIES